MLRAGGKVANDVWPAISATSFNIPDRWGQRAPAGRYESKAQRRGTSRPRTPGWSQEQRRTDDYTDWAFYRWKGVVDGLTEYVVDPTAVEVGLPSNKGCLATGQGVPSWLLFLSF